MKIVLLLLPLFLYADLFYTANYQKEIEILDSFDVSPNFIYDPIMNEMIEDLHGEYQTMLFFKALNRGAVFIPAIKQVLAKHHVPKEFLYLAMAESKFENQAYSTKRAAGIWQFMPKTAELFGLKIDEYVDERRDPIKSTVAAAKFLNFLYKRFGKWYLAAIAYNCGGGRLNQAIKEAQSDDLATLLDPDAKYIPKESRFYIRKILALALLANNEEYLLNSQNEYLLNRSNTASIEPITLPSGESLQRVADMLDIPFEELRDLNKQLKYDFIPPYKEGYTIYIPHEKLALFKQIYKPSPVKNIYIVHKVQPGDNLWNIGKKYGVSYKVIVDFNHLEDTRLHLKQSLIIPIERNKKKKVIQSDNYYIVQKGDTLEGISKKYHISVAALKEQNHLKDSLIKVGDRLRVYE